ncbi:glycosyltransferase family 1 protein [Rhodoblastus acidophilus]|uniref:Glycosyltransferase family 1 protein n=1 Tax=Rhodoblastus acidophilus TaxID=1074 RepID=A0A6N8DTI5_RHOAC|nr:glycosyltransferase family 1 protein [Rhodoblastus acidophilus]MCW2275851.1 2-beta-glucuronyltransferase [Rhodoblastus acidophilus]MTV32503.1 glycosyltransferase family 1 protein [Rhodoblastus acidophilus]
MIVLFRRPNEMHAKKNFLIISAHDFRSRRKANMHFIANELAKRGTTRFFSTRFSEITRFRPDPRHDLYDRANRVETVNDVDCYLWKTPVHAFNTRLKALRPVENLFFRIYQSAAPEILKTWIEEATTIIFESGYAIIFFDLVKQLNPDSQTIYIASDAMKTINAASYPDEVLQNVAPQLTSIAVPSRLLRDEFPGNARVFYAPHGIDPSIKDQADPNPYTAELNAVSVGSMLFDRELIRSAADQMPDVTFHVIGSGDKWLTDRPGNVVVYDEMPHRETLRYIKHATFGIAPYRGEAPFYLADTSMKLMQYELFGLPTICPETVVGDNPMRVGYDASDRDSVKRAMLAAMAMPHATKRQFLTWTDVADRILAPDLFEDTKLVA